MDELKLTIKTSRPLQSTVKENIRKYIFNALEWCGYVVSVEINDEICPKCKGKL